MTYIKRAVTLAGCSFLVWAWVLGGASAQSAEPPTPREVSRALFVQTDAMLVKVFDGPARVRSVYCTQRVVNGQRVRSAGCRIVFTHGLESVQVWGTLRQEPCAEVRGFEDSSGCLHVRHSGVLWRYRYFQPHD
jgi:hypothetical protein